MSSRHFVAIAALGSLAGLAGCGSFNKTIGMEDPAFGEAVKYDVAVQTINPDPVYPPGGAQPGDSGAMGASAIKRYRTDTVKQLQSMQTSGSSAGGSGSTPR